MNKEQLDFYLDIIAKKSLTTIKKAGYERLEYPTSDDGNYFDIDKKNTKPLKHIFSWMQSFFCGIAGISYAITKNPEYIKWLYSSYEQYYEKVFVYGFETMHDLGFLYSPYAVLMYKLTGDNKMKELAVRAADELMKRFVPNGHYIRAWGRMDNVIPDYVDEELAKNHFFTQSDGLAIVDCMMNLPLLFFASEVTKQPIYKNIAIEHLETTLKYFVRDDYSVCHAYRFDPKTGEALSVENFCGYNNDSHWARGTTWIMYGLVVAYKHTRNERYLDIYEKITQKFIDECASDGIPMWDFRLPEGQPAFMRRAKWDVTDENNKQYAVDTSAAAIAVCSIQQYSKFKTNKDFTKYKDIAITTLCEKYFNNNTEVCGIISHTDGEMKYSAFGDYYTAEALSTERYDLDVCWL